MCLSFAFPFVVNAPIAASPAFRQTTCRLLQERPSRTLGSSFCRQPRITSNKISAQSLHFDRLDSFEASHTMTDQAVHEPEANRYVIRLEGVSEPAFLQYHIEDLPSGKVYNLTHTYVNPAMRGKGIAARLVQKAITHAREDNHKIIPTCSYIAAYMRRHEQDRDVVYEE